MSAFAHGDKATVVLDGRVCHVFTVERVRGNMVCGTHVEVTDGERTWSSWAHFESLAVTERAPPMPAGEEAWCG